MLDMYFWCVYVCVYVYLRVCVCMRVNELVCETLRNHQIDEMRAVSRLGWPSRGAARTASISRCGRPIEGHKAPGNVNLCD